jgi:site-specific DNA-cytosine methylase
MSHTSHSCIFSDLGNMHNKTAHCVVHDKECEVKYVVGVAIGTSCTSASRYNAKSGSIKGLLEDDDVENATFDSWRAACRFLKFHRPCFGLLENVPELDSKDDDNDSNLDVGLSMIREAGFWAYHIVLHTDKYLLPQSRRRIYIFAINMSGAGMGPIAPNLGKTLEKTLRAMEHDPVPYSQLLLPSDSAELTKELGRLQVMKDERANQKVKDEKWMEEHANYFKQKGLRWGHAKPSADLAGSLWFKRLSEREKDCLVVAEKLGAAYVDFSQGVSRMRSSTNRDSDLLFTMCPGQKVFLFGSHWRMMLGRESLTMQGFPWQAEECINNTTEALMNDLSGNAFSLPVIVALLTSTLLICPFSDVAVVASDSDEEDNEPPSPLA